MTDFFQGVSQIQYEGLQTDNEFAFRHYNPDEMVMGKSLKEHLRFAVAYWHSFAWEGGDPFGGRTFDRPWFGSQMALAKLKADVAFEMFDILGVPYFCFHDADMRPEGRNFAENTRNLEEMVEYFALENGNVTNPFVMGHCEFVFPQALYGRGGDEPGS
jgi:xylose isomerase